MKSLLMRMLGQRSQWFTENVFFVSWHKDFKGVYTHFLPGVRCVYLWGIVWRQRSEMTAMRHDDLDGYAR